LHTFRKYEHILAASLIALLVFLALFLLRSFDDNRLTSWRWVFDEINAGGVYLALLAGLVLAYLLYRRPLPGPRLLFMLAFLTSAVFWREPEVILDASRYFTQAKHLETYGVGYFLREWGGKIPAWTDMPLVPFLYGLIFRYLGESRIYIQVFTTLLFSLTAVLVLLMGRDLWDERVGSAAGALLLGMPYLLTQVPLMLVDVPSMFLLTLSAFTFNRALSRGGALMAVLSALAVSSCALSKYSLWLMLSLLPVMLLVRLVCNRKGQAHTGGLRQSELMKRGIAVFFLSGAFLGCFFLYKYGVISGQIRLLVDYQRPGLRRWTESYASTFLFQVHPFIAIGALYSVYAAVRKRDLKHIIPAWLLVLMLFMQVKRIRYFVPVFPMLALMAACGVRGIRDEGLGRFVVLAAVASSLAVAAFGYLPFLEGFTLRNLRDAGSYIDSLDAERVRVYTLPQRSKVNPAVSVPLLDLFTEKEIIYDYGPLAASPPKGFHRLPLRFTWHYRNPGYYEPPESRPGDEVTAIISGREDFSLPVHIKREAGECRAPKVFGAATGIFRFRSVVTVCRRADSDAP
jgi:hypothetical protein